MKKFLILFIFIISITDAFSKEAYRYVQVLAIRDFYRAQNMMQDLDKLGYRYLVRDSVKKSERYYRIVVGPFGSRKETEKEQKLLQKKLRIKSSFILTYYELPSSTVDINTGEPITIVKKPPKKIENNIVKKSEKTEPVKIIRFDNEKVEAKKSEPIIEEKKVIEPVIVKEPEIKTVEPVVKKEEPKPEVKIEKKEPKVVKRVTSNNIIIEDPNYKKRLDKIVNLSFSKDTFLANRDFVCNELNSLVDKNYAPAILLLASNYIKGDECVDQDLTKAITSLELLQNEKELPEHFSKFSKELLAETYIKTADKENINKARKILESLLVNPSDDKYSIYIYKRLAYVEYSLKDYEAMNLWLDEASRLGDVESQLSLGKSYFKGLGAQQNIKKAKYYLNKCVDINAECSEIMGSIYLNLNLLTPPDIKKAYTYFSKAKELGSIKATQLVENKDSIEEFYKLMQEDTIKYRLVEEYLRKYLNNQDMKELKISNINKIREGLYEVYMSFNLNGSDKVAKMIFNKNRHDYWVTLKFKMSDSILDLK